MEGGAAKYRRHSQPPVFDRPERISTGTERMNSTEEEAEVDGATTVLGTTAQEGTTKNEGEGVTKKTAGTIARARRRLSVAEMVETEMIRASFYEEKSAAQSFAAVLKNTVKNHVIPSSSTISASGFFRASEELAEAEPRRYWKSVHDSFVAEETIPRFDD